MLKRAVKAVWTLAFLALFGFLAFQVGVATKSNPQQQQAHDSAAQNHESKNPIKRFWEWTTHDPVAFYTSLLALFTLVLGGSTVALWWETRRIRSSAAEDTRTLQRAYINVEAAGISPSRGDGTKCHPNIIIKNAGNLPAQHVKWAMTWAVDQADRRSDLPTENLTLAGNNTLPPKAEMLQGGPIIYLGNEPNDLRSEMGLYLYVWGIVLYEDGFDNPRSTRFCHRYNTLNLEWADVVLGKTATYPRGQQIDAHHARFNRYGNEAT